MPDIPNFLARCNGRSGRKIEFLHHPCDVTWISLDCVLPCRPFVRLDRHRYTGENQLARSQIFSGVEGSIVKPSGFLDGHPASSKLDLFEGIARRMATL
jgi:hypothetical protein